QCIIALSQYIWNAIFKKSKTVSVSKQKTCHDKNKSGDECFFLRYKKQYLITKVSEFKKNK
ncbi:hypothetical protein BMETH_348048232164, partial [methanotrophic bacterial endosymbiont of Bathymodiolus sp.]